MKVPMITREELGFFLSANMSTETVKSDYLQGTIFEEWDLSSDWLVNYLYVNEGGVLVIECVPKEYQNA